MKIHCCCMILLLAAGGCGPVSYWANSSTAGIFDFLSPATSRYKYPPGYDPGTPQPRSGPVPKKPTPPPLPLPGEELETPGSPATDAAAKPADGSSATPPGFAKS